MRNKKYYMPFCILVFTYDEDKIYQKEDKYYIKYTNVKWELKSMKQYDELDVYINNECLYKIFNKNNLVKEGWLMDIPDFARKVRVEYKL